jgi:hypothetical protein
MHSGTMLPILVWLFVFVCFGYPLSVFIHSDFVCPNWWQNGSICWVLRVNIIVKISSNIILCSIPFYFIFLVWTTAVCLQAGTYIKEFVHGDLGRTNPRYPSFLSIFRYLANYQIYGVCYCECLLSYSIHLQINNNLIWKFEYSLLISFVAHILRSFYCSIGSILGCRAEILQLDVTDVKMDLLQ